MNDTPSNVDTRADVVVVGAINLDLVARVDRIPGPGETLLSTDYAEYPGGKGLNQAVAAARAGSSVALVAAVGDDEAGGRLGATVRDEGIVGDHLVVVPVPTGRAMIAVDANAENAIVVVAGANDELRPPPRPFSCRALLAQLEVPMATVQTAFSQHSDAIKVFNPSPAGTLPNEFLSLVDVCVPNEHEIGLLGGVDALHAAGVEHVVVTRGAAGVTIHTRDADPVDVPAFSVEPIDTTGAGDAFCGAMTARLAAGDDLFDAVRFGAAAGALATTVAGAVPAIPHRDAIDALIG